jgi:hypothetical protein
MLRKHFSEAEAALKDMLPLDYKYSRGVGGERPYSCLMNVIEIIHFET